MDDPPASGPGIGGRDQERNIHESLDVLEDAQEVAKIGFWSLDLRDSSLAWSSGLKLIFGLDPAGPAPSFERFFAFVHPDDLGFVNEKVREQTDRVNKERTTYIYRIIAADGSTRYLEHIGKQSLDDEGRLIVIYGSVQDVTERVTTERLLASERERLAVTLRSIGDGVVTTDTEGRVVLLNRAAEDMTGWKTEEAAGRPLAEVFKLVDDFTREPRPDPVEAVFRTGSVRELEPGARLVSRDGRETLIADSGAPIHDDESRVIGAALVFRDVTEKRRLEETMMRTQRLEALGVLAGGIAHDFNNLLSGLFGNIDIAYERFKEGRLDEVPRHLDKAIAVFDRTRALTKQLLTFSKGGEPVRKVQRLGPLIRQSVAFALSGSNVTSRLSVDEDLWPCDCDENQIGQVVDNLAINAKQAMPGGGELVVTAQNAEVDAAPDWAAAGGRSFVKIALRDSGDGIPAEIVHKIFDPFFTTKAQGHGLGLPTAFSIMRRHRGWIQVDSEPGAGSTFTVFLPATPDGPVAEPARSAAIATGSGRVLVMDDEEYMRDIVGEMLCSMGYRVEAVVNGQEAIRSFSLALGSGEPFSACILDLTIPGGSGGKAVAAELRGLDPEAVLVATSGYSEDPIMAKPAEHGFDDRLLKPFRHAELSELFERIGPRMRRG